MTPNQKMFLAIAATAGVAYFLFRQQAQAAAALTSTAAMGVPNWFPNNSTITNFGTNQIPLILPWKAGSAYSLSGVGRKPMAFCC